ncbi:MAG: sigma 54-interacting transcriptional regulator [Victivallales bacterium]|nr:sigma 54-interacting transcriptional regulator [Victivallales bacterium]
MFTTSEISQIKLFGQLIFTNPFSAERLDIERQLLGSRHIQRYRVWHSLNGELSVNWNLPAIAELCNHLVDKGLSLLEKGGFPLNGEMLAAWDLLAIYWLFSKYSPAMSRNIYLAAEVEEKSSLLYEEFQQDFDRLITHLPRKKPSIYAPEKIFALCHQVHRAFNYIFDFIAGGTSSAAELRSAIWESIFTHDMGLYYRQLYSEMNQITTLITGESGTGKELAAQAISYSQFIPFNSAEKRFEFPYRDCFHPVQLSAMPPTLIESELFGHVKGAFTGAVTDRQGPFENCRPCECVFLDEIGEVPLDVQVKLLRLLQTRQFQRIGDVELKSFGGKVIAATNSVLADGCRNGTFRQDLLFRICSDTIQTVPLRTLLDGKEEELRQFVTILAKRILSTEDIQPFVEKCCKWIVTNLGMDYPWPGNVRELEQCLRNLLVRGKYTPLLKARSIPAFDIGEQMADSGLTAEELVRKYVKALHNRGCSALKISQLSGLDRRTVKKYLGN